MPPTDPFSLERFVMAQTPLLDTALAELRQGRKQSHWMWFVFPQGRGLGSSSTALFYGLGSLDEARAYLAHPLLKARLEQATQTVLALGAIDLHALFGSPDDKKFLSSMSLFALASPTTDTPFHQALERWNKGRPDEATLRFLDQPPPTA
ncbi:calpastatin [Rhodospirillum rubrum]|uniref:DUF1810 domain-containing protein n=1 Tax=Rhodospirillum rubrum TaxID=1085 RepID=UPI001903B3F9|nr:DUF1810 domain-containing protein [Rhodospirillum rubrum]MBK1664832.1 calpastatin [Rhodospirillum rubrum]MBK1678487.1 calpastatin [Rhodospirillum rubrum]